MSTGGGDRLKVACITVLGSGYLRPAPGTWGSAVAVALFLVLWCGGICGLGQRAAVEIGLVAGVMLASVLSVAWGEWALARFGGPDPKHFVLDEFAGQWVALFGLPLLPGAGWWTFAWVVGGQFVLFRLMDIIKPPPARQCERLPAGWGILVDDLWAGAYANVLGQLVWRFSPLAAWVGVTG